MKISMISKSAALVIIIVISIIFISYISSPTGKVVWMQEGDELNILFTYEGQSKLSLVSLFDVAGNNNRTLCGFLVDGEHIWIEEGQDNMMKGLRIYVRKVILVRDQLQDKDVCKVAFAGSIIKIVNGSLDKNETEQKMQSSTVYVEPDEVEQINTTINTSNLTGNQDTEESEEDMQETIIIEERPARQGFFSRIRDWLKTIF